MRDKQNRRGRAGNEEGETDFNRESSLSSCRDGLDRVRVAAISLEINHSLLLISARLRPGHRPRTHAAHAAFKEIKEALQHVDTSKRLGIAFLAGRDSGYVCCTLLNLERMLLPTKPADILIFATTPLVEEQTKEECGHTIANISNAMFVELKDKWYTPDIDRSLWAATYFDENYRRMGQWRLEFQFHFLHRLGYKYALQFDDDSRLLAPVPYNIVERMQEGQHHWAARNVVHDEVWVTTGLPELTRYFIVTEGLQPTQLYNFCSPSNINGVFTQKTGIVFDDAGQQVEGAGWQPKVLYGNLVVVSLDFWFQPLQQRFLKLVIASGGHFRFRWNEQGVIGMMWQLFSRKEDLMLLDFPYAHGVKECFPQA